jgi:hypothetical protein
VLAAAVRRRPDVDPGELIAAGGDQLHPQLDANLDVGLTKLVIRQAGTAPLDAFIDRFVAELAGRQNCGQRSVLRQSAFLLAEWSTECRALGSR